MRVMRVTVRAMRARMRVMILTLKMFLKHVVEQYK